MIQVAQSKQAASVQSSKFILTSRKMVDIYSIYYCFNYLDFICNTELNT